MSIDYSIHTEEVKPVIHPPYIPRTPPDDYDYDKQLKQPIKLLDDRTS